MYLKSIEVQGFKSLANKIVFEFHNGITGIVGPQRQRKEQCGPMQSAGSWESRSVKQLRERLPCRDVIFSGTETRKPLGLCLGGHHAGQLRSSSWPIDFDQKSQCHRRILPVRRERVPASREPVPLERISTSCFMIQVLEKKDIRLSVRDRLTKS